MQASQKNYDIALCNLGFCYENGIGVERDDQKAVEDYLKAIEQNNLRGMWGNCLILLTKRAEWMVKSIIRQQ